MGWSQEKWKRYVERRTRPRHVHTWLTLTEIEKHHARITVNVCPDCRQVDILPFADFAGTTPTFKHNLKAYLVKMGYGLHADAAIAGRAPSESVAVGQ